MLHLIVILALCLIGFFFLVTAAVSFALWRLASGLQRSMKKNRP